MCAKTYLNIYVHGFKNLQASGASCGPPKPFMVPQGAVDPSLGTTVLDISV